MRFFLFLYFRYKVYNAFPKNELENSYLQELEKNPQFDFWSKINKAGNPVSIMVPPKFQEEFENYLTVHDINFETIIENVER